MKTILKLLVLVPLAILAAAFAFANRQGVTVSFDPFATDVPAFALSGPLFVVIILVVITGVVLGGVATWLGQGRYRRRLRVAKREAENLRAEVARLKADLADAGSATIGTTQAEIPRYPALPGRNAA